MPRPSILPIRADPALLLGLLLLSGPLPAQTPEDPSLLVVTGTARVEVAPDRARITFAVETEAETAREAGEANARLMDRVMDAVRATGIPDLRLETSGYTLTPRYGTVRDDRVREIVGYTARNQVVATLDDVDAVGRAVDAALGAGANRVAGLQFLVRDPEPHRREALRRAVERARGEAEVIASALGVRLGLPHQVQGGAEIPPIPPMAFRAEAVMLMEDQPVTPVEAGLQTISATVTIRFRIHGDG